LQRVPLWWTGSAGEGRVQVCDFGPDSIHWANLILMCDFLL
jgi:hypothetical protein